MNDYDTANIKDMTLDHSETQIADDNDNDDNKNNDDDDEAISKIIAAWSPNRQAECTLLKRSIFFLKKINRSKKVPMYKNQKAKKNKHNIESLSAGTTF